MLGSILSMRPHAFSLPSFQLTLAPGPFFFSVHPLSIIDAVAINSIQPDPLINACVDSFDPQQLLQLTYLQKDDRAAEWKQEGNA